MKKVITIILIIISTCGILFTALRGQTNALICFCVSLLLSVRSLDHLDNEQP